EQELRRHAPNAVIHFERVALTPEQVVEFGLEAALRDTKTTDPRYRWFLEKYKEVDIMQGGRLSVELEALKPSLLRNLVRVDIERHLPREQLDITNAQGEQEKLKLGLMLDRYLDELYEPAPITVCRNGGPATGNWIAEYLAEPEAPRHQQN